MDAFDFANEWDALKEVDKHYGCIKGFFYPKDPFREPSAEEEAALQYLIDVWDYGYKALQ